MSNLWDTVAKVKEIINSPQPLVFPPHITTEEERKQRKLQKALNRYLVKSTAQRYLESKKDDSSNLS